MTMVLKLSKSTEKPRALKMVGWYDPAQLLRTAGHVIVSTLLARHIDDRRLQGLAPAAEDFADYRGERSRDETGKFTFDFVADTGDGWNSTYAVALALSKPSLT